MTETYRYKGDYGLMIHIRRDTVEEIEAVAARLFAALPEEVNQFHVERRIARVRRPRGAAIQLPASPFPPSDDGRTGRACPPLARSDYSGDDR